MRVGIILSVKKFPVYGRKFLEILVLFILKSRYVIHFCRNGYSFETSLLLSVFLGMFGADRFYLGYPAIGLFKLCTLGCMFLGNNKSDY